MEQVNSLQRYTRLAVVLALLATSVLPIITLHKTASAYTLLGDREIRMSSSEVDTTGVTYRADFDIATDGDVGGIVISFCKNTPIIEDNSCTEAAGLSLSATVANADAGTHDLSAWTAAADSELTDGGTSNNTFTLSDTTAITMSSGDNIVFEMTNADNPSATETFYARIMTYATEGDATGYATGSTGTEVDAGGIALSTAEVITVEAKVQERLEFCVFVTSGALNYDETDCSAVTDPIQLGDENGVLSSTAPSISKGAKFNVTTNTSTGATIRLQGDTLQAGAFSIDAIGDTTPGDGIETGSTTETEQFGLCVYRDVNSATGLTPVAPYDDNGNGNCAGTTDGQGIGNDNGALFAFDTDGTDAGVYEQVTGGVTSQYGQAIATKATGDWSTGVLVFLGNVSNTTEPGIYATTLDFIATGRY